MEVDDAPLRSLDPSVAVVRVQLDDGAMRRGLVILDLAADLARVILELPVGGIEGIANRDIHVLVGMVLAGCAADHDLVSGHRDVDLGVVEIALVVMAVLRFDNHATGHDVVQKRVQLGGLLANVGLHGVGRIHVAKGDLQR